MDSISEALKFIRDNGSLFWNHETEKFVCIFIVGLNCDFEYAGEGNTPEEAAKDFLDNKKKLVEIYHAAYLQERYENE